MLKLQNINKKFKSIVIADNISLQLDNCTYGLLGKNGSGKTTLLRCITEVEKLDSGKISYVHGDSETGSYLDHIGYLPQSFDIFNELTPCEVLRFFANLKKYSITDAEIEELLTSLNLIYHKDAMVKNLSGGMKRRLGIAQALIGNPDILLLDEPTAGLDPEERLNFKNVVRRVKNNRCVVLSTHIITDIEALCDKILILINGNVTQFDSCAQLAHVANGKVFAVENLDEITCRFYSMGAVTVDNKNYEKVICKEPINALPLNPTVEDGYLCFIENLN